MKIKVEGLINVLVGCEISLLAQLLGIDSDQIHFRIPEQDE